jgi:regulator of sigma E protease
LLDERDAPVPASERHLSFNQRPPWQRILVLLAGPGINILFAVLLLWIVYAVAGRTEARADVGYVRPGTIAAAAGLTRGDKIVAVNSDAVSGRGSVVIDLIQAVSGDGDITVRVVSANGATRDRILHIPDENDRLAMTEPDNMPDKLGFLFRGPPVVLDNLTAGGPADLAGLRADEVLAVNDEPMPDLGQFMARVQEAPGATLIVSYRRGGETRTTSVNVSSVPTEKGKVAAVGKIRTGFARPTDAWVASALEPSNYSIVGALGAALQESWRMTSLQASMLWKMLTGRVSRKNLSGPITIAQVAGQSARGGVESFVSILIVISLSLGFLNLLPIPILDGGQVVYQIAEWLKGSPLSERAQALGQQIGIALLVLLMGVAFFNDIVRQIQPG